MVLPNVKVMGGTKACETVLCITTIALVQVKSLCFDHSGTYLAVAGSDVR